MREPPRLKTSRQQTVVATTIRPPMFIASIATIPGKIISVFFGGKEVFADKRKGKQLGFLEQVADGIIAAWTIVLPVSVNPFNIISGEKEKKNKSQEKGGTDRISRNRGNVEYSSISISGHEVTR